MEVSKEWFINAPWGKIALVSWGNESGSPVLLCHGRQDSAATFIPLLQRLPSTYHYVAFDLPGHGKSDAFPHGVMLSRFHMVPALCAVVEHLDWTKFTFIGHSLGTEIGLFYNATYPGRITRFVHLDPGPSLQRLQVKDFQLWYKHFYQDYYDNYNRYNVETPRLYTYDEAVQAVMKKRGLNLEQATIVLSRNLIPAGGGKYRLPWDRRLRPEGLAAINIPNEFLQKLFSLDAPPSIVIAAKDFIGGFLPGRAEVDKLLRGMQETVPHFTMIRVAGGHDVHLTNPERVAPHILEFLSKDFSDLEAKSKL